MKNKFSVLSFLIISIILPSCKKDDCGDDATSKFPGAWYITETCGSQNFNYEMTITTDGESDLIFINIGQGGPNAEIKVDVCGNDFTIPSQTVQGINFSGDGSINAAGNQINFLWNGHKGSCSATGAKQ